MAKLQTATVIRSFLPFTGYRSSGHRSRINSLAIPLQNRSRSLSPSTVKSKYAHGLFPYLRLDCRRLLPVPWDLCRRFSDSSARPIPQHLWQHRPVHRATPRQRRTTSERRHPALAPQRFLDAGRPVLHAVDDRSISVDLLRSVSSPGPAGHVPRRHHFFRLRLKRSEIHLRFGYIAFILLLSWWIFLYAFVVLPWMYAQPSFEEYNFTYNVLDTVQGMVVVVGLGMLWLRSRGGWRIIYANLFGGQATHMLSSLMINVLIDRKAYHTGSLYDLPLLASFLWFGAAGLIAYKNADKLDDASDATAENSDTRKGESILASRLAMAAVVSLPLFAIRHMLPQKYQKTKRDCGQQNCH